MATQDPRQEMNYPLVLVIVPLYMHVIARLTSSMIMWSKLTRIVIQHTDMPVKEEMRTEAVQ
jgi:hypothetical protein